MKSPEAFRTIGEVSEWLDTPAHVLRFWESKFSQIRPVKRAGGRRYYRPEDMALLGGIKTLLHEQGMTIKGVQKLLREQGIRHVASLGPGAGDGTGLAGIFPEDPQSGSAPAAGPSEAQFMSAQPSPADLPAKVPAAVPVAAPQAVPEVRTDRRMPWPDAAGQGAPPARPAQRPWSALADMALPDHAPAAPGILSALLSRDPASLRHRAGQIAPLAARLAALSDRLRATR